jgi:D-alanine-D-alanine ligase
MNKIPLLLILGGSSSERTVSLKTGHQVYKAINKNKYSVDLVDGATESRLKKISGSKPYLPYDKFILNCQEKPQLAFIALHGKHGEDGEIQAFLDRQKIRYTFSGVKASKDSMDKEIAKSIYRQHELPVAPDFILSKDDCLNQKLIIKTLGLPIVCKPANEGSSYGITIVRDPGQLEKATANAFKFDKKVIIEKYIDGREITVAVLGNNHPKALPPIEIILKKTDFFDYNAKYKVGASEEICPAKIPKKITQKSQKIAIEAHRALGCRGVSRSDFIFDRDLRIYLLETNTIPGMTPTSLLPKAATAAGYSFEALIQKILDLALEN